MGDESPGAMIRRARQEAGMKQRDLAERMGVHVTTVGYWERNKFFPEQHWAALNKLLHINLTAPGGSPAGQEPDSTVPPEVLEMIRRYYPDPEQQRRAILALEELEEPNGPPGEARYEPGTGTSRAG